MGRKYARRYSSRNISDWRGWLNSLRESNNIIEEFLIQSAYIEGLIKFYAEMQFELATGGFTTKKKRILRVLKSRIRRYQLGELIAFLRSAKLIDEVEGELISQYKDKRNAVIHDLFSELSSDISGRKISRTLKIGEEIISIRRFSIITKSFKEREEGGISNLTYQAFKKPSTKSGSLFINAREEEILADYLQKRPLAQIGKRFSISGERVRQVLERVGTKINQIRFGNIEGKRRYTEQKALLKVQKVKKGAEAESIISVVAKQFGYTADEIRGKSRKGKLVIPRHIIYFLLKEKVGLSYPVIGNLLNRDHTTVMHGHKKIKQLVQTGKITIPA